MTGEQEKMKPDRRNFAVIARTDSLITVEVGPAPEKYRVFKAFLTDHSEYFARALIGPWLEAEEEKVALTDIEPGIFNIFVNYIHGEKLPSSADQWMNAIEPEEVPKDREKLLRASDLAQLKAICLADRLIAPGFMKTLNNHYVNDKFEEAPKYSSVIYAFKHLPQDNRLLKFLVDQQSYNWQEKMDKLDGKLQLQNELPRDFLLDVMKKVTEIKTTLANSIKTYKNSKKSKTSEKEKNNNDDPITKLNPCAYHIHDDVKEKRKCEEDAEWETKHDTDDDTDDDTSSTSSTDED